MTDEVKKLDLETTDTTSIPNNLFNEMTNVTQRVDRVTDYYFIRNVLHSKSSYSDVWIQANNLTHEQKLSLLVWHASSDLNVPYTDDEQPTWEEMEPMLNGYGRIIDFNAAGGNEETNWETSPFDF